MLEVINLRDPKWIAILRAQREEFEIMAANILNRGVESMGDVTYYCAKCTAPKLQGWIHCPFCGIVDHYYYTPLTQDKVEGVGLVKLHNPFTLPDGKSPTAEEPPGRVSSEEEQFNCAIKTVRSAFENLQRSRKERKKLEARLPEGMKDCTIEFKECEKGHGRLTATNWIDDGCSKCKIDSFRQTMEVQIEQIKSLRELPQPFALRNVYGQRANSDLKEVLGILRIDQGYLVYDITVRLP